MANSLETFHPQADWLRIDRWLHPSASLPSELLGIADWRADGKRDFESASRLKDARLANALVNLTAPAILQKIRIATQQDLLVLKGPEIADAYPEAGLRPYGDLDILVRDAPAAERALLDAGFIRLGQPGVDDLPGHYHDIPLKFPGTPLAIELHNSPGWLSWMTPPSVEELFLRAVPSATNVDGVVTLPPVEHSLYLAVHSWQHGPFHSLLHLIDIELMRYRCDPAELESSALKWGITKLWDHTLNMIDWCFFDPDRQLTPIERLWSRHLRGSRRRTLRELYLATRTKGLAADSPADIVSALASDAVWTVKLRPGESYRSVGRYAIRGLRSKGSPAYTRARRS